MHSSEASSTKRYHELCIYALLRGNALRARVTTAVRDINDGERDVLEVRAGGRGVSPCPSVNDDQVWRLHNSFLFCLGIHPILEQLHKGLPDILVRAICDDVHLAGQDADVAAAYLQMQEQMAANGLLFRYGPRKTCCWSPSFPQGPSEADKAARAARSALPAAMPRLAGGMHMLGSFIGTDDFVRAAALAHVEGVDASSIRSAVDAVSLLAASEARNPRDVAGTLLRVCVV